MSDRLTEDRIKEAIKSAQWQFWEQIAADFPEVKTGDFPPDATVAFDNACEKAVDVWLTFNHPKRTT